MGEAENETEVALREEILRSNHALRGWAAGLRARGAAARRLAQRRRDPGPTLEGPDAATPAEGGVVMAPAHGDDDRASSDGPLPSMGTVAVSDLFVILVEDHDFGVMAAVRALATALVQAGYPEDYDTVSAPDALDIIQTALRQR